jgi:hypothetical protein
VAGAAALPAVAALAVGTAAPAAAATIVDTNGHVGEITLTDTATNPGATCRSVRPLLNPESVRLNRIILRGPTVGPLLARVSAGDRPVAIFVPALVSVDFQVHQRLVVNGEPAGNRLVLSAVHQVPVTSSASTAVPDHTFDASRLSSGLYTARIVVTYASPDGRVIHGSRVVHYDFYRETLSEFVLGRFTERLLGVGRGCGQ